MDCAKLPTGEIRDIIFDDDTEIVAFITIHGEEYNSYVSHEFVDRHKNMAGSFILDNGSVSFIQGWKLDLKDTYVYDDDADEACIGEMHLIDTHNDKIIATITGTGETVKIAMKNVHDQLTSVFKIHLVDKYKDDAEDISRTLIMTTWAEKRKYL